MKADLPVNLIADCAVTGLELQVQPVRPQGDGTWAFSLEGLLPNAWEMLAAEVRAGEVLVGRVQNIVREKGLVFVDVLPGVVGVCHISELDYHHVHDIEDYVRVGELLPFQIMEMDAAEMRLQLSRKAALAERPRPCREPTARRLAVADEGGSALVVVI